MTVKEINTEHLIGDVIGGIIAGLIGFFSAWGMLKLEEWRNKRKESKELLDKLYLELSKNWFALAMDIRENTVGVHKLSNVCWNVDIVSKIDIRDTNLIGGLELLYREINSFNNLCDMGRTEKLYNLRAISAIDRLKEDDCRVPKALLIRIKQFKALVFAELVKVKKRKASEWDIERNEEKFDWRTAKNPYILDATEKRESKSE
ncbi:MAG: hypothetical protein AMJ78_00625 [Omnitrophica WOR_2 bacterium SM23_29]|nr:MAG: hypothetical protein AMJ78_00625 [Omnitrophica WOR_2 bacterium SM23_29]